MPVIDPEAIIRVSNYINATEKDATPASDEGKVPKLESNAKISPQFVSTVLAKQLTQQTFNGAVTTAETTVFSATIPAGLLATANGVRYKCFHTHQTPGVNADSTIRVKFGGSTIITFGVPENQEQSLVEIMIFNNGSTASQVARAIGVGAGSVAYATGTTAADTTANVTLEVTVQPTGSVPTGCSGTIDAQILEVL